MTDRKVSVFWWTVYSSSEQCKRYERRQMGKKGKGEKCRDTLMGRGLLAFYAPIIWMILYASNASKKALQDRMAFSVKLKNKHYAQSNATDSKHIFKRGMSPEKMNKLLQMYPPSTLYSTFSFCLSVCLFLFLLVFFSACEAAMPRTV